MSDPNAPPQLPSEPENLSRMRERLTAAGKSGGLVLSLHKNSWGIPSASVTVASNIGDHVTFGAGFEAKAKQRPNANLYMMVWW